MTKTTVEMISGLGNDLKVANVARVSFDKWKEEFDSSDIGLINFLARHEHTTPFRHVIITMAFEEIPFDIFSLEQYDFAGLLWHQVDSEGCRMIQHSLFGWINLIRKGAIKQEYAGGILEHLSNIAPVSLMAYDIDTSFHVDRKVKLVTQEELIKSKAHPDYINISIRCKAPIYVARQLGKHQVNMSWNEVSRRYVGTGVEFHEQELRSKPEGSIKQGSGEVLEKEQYPMFVNIINCNDEEEEIVLGIDYVTDMIKEWYDFSIKRGVAPETLRGYLPQSMMTTWIWTGSLTSFLHVYRLRIDGHAQVEVQDFAKELDATITDVVPSWSELKG